MLGMKKEIISLLLSIALSFSAFGQTPDFGFSRSRLFSGFDGKLCKHTPSIATDWEGTMVMAYGNLLLTGSYNSIWFLKITAK